MEKVGVLITRLFEQYRNKSSVEQLQITAELLLNELEKHGETEQSFPSVVSVFYPSHKYTSKNTGEEIVSTEQHAEAAVVPADENKPGEVKVNYRKFFDPMVEIPTLALKRQEVNETIATDKESLNDKLKASTSHKEVAHNIKEEPIKDLRKAIGINDQYLFINELFRGDQTMYERSIKTINGFNIYGEAEFWIKRELKLKLAWNDNSETVKLFDQLIKRRFV